MARVRRNMNKNKVIATDKYPSQTLDSNEPHASQEVAKGDDLYAHLTKQFQVSVLDVMKKTLNQEVEKRKVVEVKPEKKKEDLKFYAIQNAKLEAMLDMRVANSGCDGGDGGGEEVQSSCNTNFSSCKLV